VESISVSNDSEMSTSSSLSMLSWYISLIDDRANIVLGELFLRSYGAVDVDFDTCGLCLRRNCRQ
jgi:hypothetical protein